MKKVFGIILILLGILLIAIGCSGNDNDVSSNDSSSIIISETSNEETSYNEIYTPTLEEKNALKQAQSYIDLMGFSEQDLKDQLEYHNYSISAIDYAIANCNVNWFYEAAEKAQDYLDTMSFSRTDLYEQLEYHGFTTEQIEYALKQVGY